MKKKIVVFILVLCLCIPFVSSLTSCALIDKVFNKKFDLANSVIKNFANYTSIGAAYVKENLNDNNAQPLSVGNGKSLASPFTVTSLDDKKDKKDEKIKLVGKDKKGKYEEIEFEKDGEDIEQTWNVVEFMIFGKYLFITYSNKEGRDYNKFCTNGSFRILNSEELTTFVVDLSTGRIYPTTNFEKACVEISGTIPNLSSIQCFEESLYFLADGSERGVYKMHIKNEDLIIKKITDSENLDFEEMLVDCYGNIFLYWWDSYSAEYFAIDRNEKINQVGSGHIAKAVDGRVYRINNPNMKFNENCELVELAENEEFVSNRYKLVSIKNNIKYYFLEQGWYGWEHSSYNSLVKTIWDDNGNFTTERFILDRNYKEYAFTQNRIYFLDTQSIFYYDLNTNTYHELLSDYVFNSIKTGYDNDIIFTGLDYSLKLVNGTIKDDGTVNVEVSDSNYEIIYIKPLNI